MYRQIQSVGKVDDKCTRFPPWSTEDAPLTMSDDDGEQWHRQNRLGRIQHPRAWWSTGSSAAIPTVAQ